MTTNNMSRTHKTLWLALSAAILLSFSVPLLAQWGNDENPPAANESIGTSGNTIPLFEVNNADIRSVLKLLSTFSTVDIVPDKSVNGNISLKVTNKNWKEILSIVCRVLNLMPIKESSYIYVMTMADYRAQQADNSSATLLSENSGPLQREIIRVANLPASEMTGSVQSLLSSRGRITVADHTNALIVSDTKERINQVRAVIQQLDVETQQISISCKMIQVSSGVLQNMGIHWGAFNADIGGAIEHLPATGIVSGALEKLSYGVISPQRFSVALEYLFTDNRGEVVAQPQITTLDNKQARIFMGNQVPVKYLDAARNTVIQMIDAGTELTVTPHVTEASRVLLALAPKKKSYVMQNDQPVISEQSAQTNVVVNDGETVVIAGLTSNENIKQESGIPLLKDIPFLGWLFKAWTHSKDKKDLIIFVTPHIIPRDLAAAKTVVPLAAPTQK